MQFIESDGVAKIVSPMSTVVRLLFAAMGLFPLSAPYELLYLPHWPDMFSISFIFMALISAGSIVVSGLFFCCAFAGLEKSILVDFRSRMLTYTRKAPIVPFRSVTVSFEAVQKIEVKTHTWSDGPDSYSLEVLVNEGQRFNIGSTESREEVEWYAARIRQLLSVVCPE